MHAPESSCRQEGYHLSRLKRKELKRNPRRRSFSSIKGRIVRVPRRRICPVHPGRKLSASSKTSQHSLLDLIFSKTGCRKTIVRYTGVMGRCNLCKVEYAPPSNRLLRGQRFGWNFQAWVVYQRIALRMSYRLISKAAFDLFSEQLSVPTAVGFVVKFAENYRRTEDLLLRGLLDGPVVHLDETKINILGGRPIRVGSYRQRSGGFQVKTESRDGFSQATIFHLQGHCRDRLLWRIRRAPLSAAEMPRPFDQRLE